MGKFFDALKKAENSRAQHTPGSTSREIVSMPHEKVDALRMDWRHPEKPVPIPLEFTGEMNPRLISFLDPQSPTAEIFRLLRTKLFCNDGVCRGRLIMVTSSQPLDGKSLVAANLAVSIARGINEHVLLVDCDLRRPSQDRIFGLKGHQGLSEYLQDGTSIEPFLLGTAVEKLTLLPAGTPPSNPAELLTSQKMESLIHEIRSRYEDRYMVLDTSPAKFTPEVTHLALQTDAVLFVVRAGKTLEKLAMDAINHIGRGKILGVVFNACSEVQKNYRNYYRYYTKDRPK